MKTNVFCVIAFVALVNGIDGIHGQPTISKTLRRTRNIEDLEICVPGETKMEDCNKCYCVVDGSGWACTRRLCGSATRMNKDRTIDQPNQNNPLNQAVEEIHVEPNNHGRLLVTPSIEDLQICVPGETKMEDCNHCFCTEDGFMWVCTIKGCSAAIELNTGGTTDQLGQNNPLNQAVEEIHAEPNNHGRLLVTRSIKDLQICVPGETRMGDCSHCTCTADGSLWTCTASCV